MWLPMDYAHLDIYDSITLIVILSQQSDQVQIQPSALIVKIYELQFRLWNECQKIKECERIKLRKKA